MNFVFDLDSTLADNEHRQHFLASEPRDWDSFYAEAPKDIPNIEIVNLAIALYQAGHHIEIWTGRSDKYRRSTRQWLDENHIPYHTLRMRQSGDERKDYEVKGGWLDIAEEHENSIPRPNIIFDDRSRSIAYFRERGYTALQVLDNNF